MADKNRKFNPRNLIFSVLIVVLLLAMLIPNWNFNTRKSIPYSEFLTQVEEKKVDKVEISGSTITYTLHDDETTYTTTEMNDPQLVDRLMASGAEFEQIPTRTNSFMSSFLTMMLGWVLIMALFGFFMNYLRRRMMGGSGNSSPFNPKNSDNDSDSSDSDEENSGGGFPFGGFGGFGQGNMGKSNAKLYKGTMTGTTFKDVAGQEEAKQNLKEIVSFLNEPARYTEIGAKMPKGALLVGPPGTGKTLLAKAVAGEAGVPFFSVSGSEFVEMFVGRGAARVRDLFKEARKKAPCIIFIDEIDTIGKKREGGGLSGNDEREQTLNQLLAEMDGFDGSKGVVLLAATNRPDSLDPALTRPGRFDRRIPVELPDLEGRQAILELHAKNVKTAPGIDYNMIARASAGTSGADLANIINEGALLAVRDGRKQVIQKDLEEAIEIVIAGEQKKNKILSNKEKMVVAYHEIGHALVSAASSHTAPVHKITIIPRTKGALGYTMQVEEEEANLQTKEELYERIVTYCGGRAAEDLIFHSITSGASNDIEMATKIARAMITRLGMSENFGMTALETVDNAYLGGDASLACSQETAAQIDKEVIELIEKAYDQAYTILENNQMKLHELAKFLFERETITGEEFMAIFSRDDAQA